VKAGRDNGATGDRATGKREREGYSFRLPISNMKPLIPKIRLIKPNDPLRRHIMLYTGRPYYPC